MAFEAHIAGHYGDRAAPMGFEIYGEMALLAHAYHLSLLRRFHDYYAEHAYELHELGPLRAGLAFLTGRSDRRDVAEAAAAISALAAKAEALGVGQEGLRD